LEALPQRLEERAKENDESVEEMLDQMVCPGITMQDYVSYVEASYKGYGYFDAVYQERVPSQKEIDAYFAQNEETFQANGITKDSGMIADVRHILIGLEGGKTGEDGQVTYSEEEWDQCLARAEELLEQWKAGDATEESFAELANQYSEDGGSNTTGGLYTGITPQTNFMESFLNWSIDENRKVGDTGIVETPYGYHIMYYVGGEPIWIYEAREAYLYDQMSDLLNEGMERWPMKVNYKKIVLGYAD